ncbi:MAG TPA: GNAT family N-acetyltransferase [Puia sp.]|nr:GNAT family N-acetyltransferase [Puia sp.]
MTIRRATSADIANVVKLVNAAYRGEGGEVGWTHEGHLISGPRTKEAEIAELLQGSGIILAGWDGKKLVGCVYLEKEGNRLYLGLLSVWPSRQGKGIGKQLMVAAASFARRQNCMAIRITVISARGELLAWYERHGFRRTGEIEPFHAGDKFGTQKQRLELVVLERAV